MAQLWAYPNAEWTTGWVSAFGPDNGYREFVLIGDSLFQGQNAHYFEISGEDISIDFNGNVLGITPYNADFFTYESNDVIFLYVDSLAAWDTLYWYGAVGDSWYPPGYQSPCEPWGKLEIQAISSLSYSGTSLSTWSLNQLDDSGASFGSFELVERMGIREWVSWIPTSNSCNTIVEFPLSTLRCYSDSAMSHFEMSGTFDPSVYSCSGFVQVPEPHQKVNFEIYPNPSSGLLSITTKEQIASVQVIDLSGRLVHSQTESLNSGTHLIDLGNLQNGVYHLRFVNKRGIAQVKTFVKH